MATLLSADERARAARFHAVEHRQRFVVAHARLRELLGVQLRVAPESLVFAEGAHGKPELAQVVAPGLQFNLSHSDTLGLVGWAWGRAIGVDIERWRPMRDEEALVRRFFSVSENQAYSDCLPLARSAAFFNIWTRKEAYVKAVGRGLGLPLDSFDVSHVAGAGACLLRSAAEHDRGSVWSLAAPEIGREVSAAVVLESSACCLIPETVESGSPGV